MYRPNGIAVVTAGLGGSGPVPCRFGAATPACRASAAAKHADTEAALDSARPFQLHSGAWRARPAPVEEEPVKTHCRAARAGNARPAPRPRWPRPGMAHPQPAVDSPPSAVRSVPIHRSAAARAADAAARGRCQRRGRAGSAAGGKRNSRAQRTNPQGAWRSPDRTQRQRRPPPRPCEPLRTARARDAESADSRTQARCASSRPDADNKFGPAISRNRAQRLLRAVRLMSLKLGNGASDGT